MDTRFASHNQHLEGTDAFARTDPHLRRLRELRLVWTSPLLEELPDATPGIYLLGGARQIGKTTLIKQWMKRRLDLGTKADRIVYLTGELIDDHHTLVRLVEDWLARTSGDEIRYLAVDEVTYVRSWDRGIKFLADAGSLERCIVLLTGSDLSLMREARSLLPGRRGRADRVDFHLHPLTYVESATLKGTLDPEECTVLEEGAIGSLDPLGPEAWDRLYGALREYLIHGGFLTAMNDMAETGTVHPSTLATYSDWIRGDVLKRGKRETYLREILSALARRLGSQLTWNSLARDLSIDHPATVADYVQLLESMDAFFIQPALREDRLAAAPKKARKVMPCDPFIVHAVRSWLSPKADPHEETILPFLDEPENRAALVEACVAGHARRHFPTYYIKATGEVDVALIESARFWPIEVKWRSRHRPKDLAQIAKYPRGVIASRTRKRGEFEGRPVLPIPQVLAMLGGGRWPPVLR